MNKMYRIFLLCGFCVLSLVSCDDYKQGITSPCSVERVRTFSASKPSDIFKEELQKELDRLDDQEGLDSATAYNQLRIYVEKKAQKSLNIQGSIDHGLPFILTCCECLCQFSCFGEYQGSLVEKEFARKKYRATVLSVLSALEHSNFDKQSVQVAEKIKRT